MTSDDRRIAIVGMACVYPGAPDVDRFWTNILSKVDAVTDPPEHWGAADVYDPESSENDRMYCKKGGFIDDFTDFNPMEFGIMPGSVDGSDPEIYLALKVAREALKDADSVASRPIDRKQTAVVLGHGSYVNRGVAAGFYHVLIMHEIIRVLKKLYPEVPEETLRRIKSGLKAGLPPFKAENCPGLISNMLSGMIANRFDLQGPNYVVDAACASSLIAVDSGIGKLLSGECDAALVGGAQAYTSLAVFIIFCLLGALSRREKIRPFDRNADGTLLGGGLGMMVLKRLSDAERDGNRIYAVIKGMGVSSDGRAQAALVPRLEGEQLALERSYQNANTSPGSVRLIEAHGTATRVGDATEIRALTHLFGNRNGDFPDCAVGTVKSMIGHTIPAAGMAGLIKTALALYHKIIPPTLCDEPNPDLGLEKTPFYINTETRPWIHGDAHPRRAGVSAFGFGGINAHAVLEEYVGADIVGKKPFAYRWDTEVVIVQSDTRDGLARAAGRLLAFVGGNPHLDLKDLAYTLNRQLADSMPLRLSIVADSVDDLGKKLEKALGRLADSSCVEITDRSGIFFFERPLAREGKLAFMYPGEGAQYVNMLADLCVHFPEVRQSFDRAERVFASRSIQPTLSQIVFLHPDAPPESRQKADILLSSILYAVASVGAADRGMNALLGRLHIEPHAIVGHSVGQDIALGISGLSDESDEQLAMANYYDTNAALYQLMSHDVPKAKLVSVGLVEGKVIADMVEESRGELHVAMDNCPNQVVLCGSEETIRGACERLSKRGAICTFLPFDRGYHTPFYGPLREHIANIVRPFEVGKRKVDVYSCTTADLFPDDHEAVKKMMVDQWLLPVRFRETIETMYAKGIRIFVEVGPRGNLTSFVEDTLRDRRHLAVPSNVPSQSSVTQLNHLVGLLAAHGVPLKPDHLYEYRSPRPLAIEGLAEGREKAADGDGSETKKKAGSMKLLLTVPRLDLEGEAEADLLSIRSSFRGAEDRRDTGKRIPGKAGPGDGGVDEKTRGILRRLWKTPVERAGGAAGATSCSCMDADGSPDVDMLAGKYLSPRERSAWENLKGPEQRRRQWLLGRVAAKEAVRHYLKKFHRVTARAPEIEITTDGFGKPIVTGDAVGNVRHALSLSIAHSGRLSVSFVGAGPGGIGIDIERAGRDHEGLEEGGFMLRERSLLDRAAPSARKEWLLRFWCAKEAAAKALGKGMMGTPLNLTIESFHPETGNIELKICGALAREAPNWENRTLIVISGRDDDLVYATTVL